MSIEASSESAAPLLTLERRGTDEDPLIVAAGEIDVASSPLLRDALSDAITSGTTTVTLDFTRVSFIDSSGLGVLVGALDRLRHSAPDARLGIAGAQDAVRKVFAITGLDRLLDLSDEVAQG